jgi:hypothetical protein
LIESLACGLVDARPGMKTAYFTPHSCHCFIEERLEATPTVIRLGEGARLRRTLASTEWCAT